MQKVSQSLVLKVWNFSLANFCILRPTSIPYKLITCFTFSTYILLKCRFEKQEQCGFTILKKNSFFHISLADFSLPLTAIQQKELPLMSFQLQNNPRAKRRFHQVLAFTGLPLAVAQTGGFLFYISLVTLYNNHFCQEIVNQFVIKICVFHFQGPHGLPGPKVIQKIP